MRRLINYISSKLNCRLSCSLFVLQYSPLYFPSKYIFPIFSHLTIATSLFRNSNSYLHDSAEFLYFYLFIYLFICLFFWFSHRWKNMTTKLPVSYHCRAGTETEVRKFSQIFPACRHAILTTLSVITRSIDETCASFSDFFFLEG